MSFIILYQINLLWVIIIKKRKNPWNLLSKHQSAPKPTIPPTFRPPRRPQNSTRSLNQKNHHKNNPRSQDGLLNKMCFTWDFWSRILKSSPTSVQKSSSSSRGCLSRLNQKHRINVGATTKKWWWDTNQSRTSSRDRS